MKRSVQVAKGNVCSARTVGQIKLRDRNQPHYGPPIAVRSMRYGTHGRDRAGRKYLKRTNIGTTLPGQSINPLLLLGHQMAMAMVGLFAGGRSFMESRKKASKRGG